MKNNWYQAIDSLEEAFNRQDFDKCDGSGLGALSQQRESLYALRSELKGILKDVNNDLETKEEQLLDKMATEGIENMKIDTGEGQRTVYVHRQKWASPTDHRKAVEALQELGLDDQLILGTSRISSYIRQFDDEEQIPPALRDALDIYERTSIRSRKA